jgi:DNA polymerase elongation subunit (family B)
MTTKLVRKPVIRKNYRLIDFHIYDERPDDSIQTVDHDSDNSDTKPTRRNDDAQFIIQMYSINEQGETCSLIVDDFAPFFYIKVGDTWDQLQVNQLLDHLKEKVGKFYSESILSATLIDRHKLYGFSAGKKHKFAQIVFKNAAVMNKTKNLWYEYVQGRDGSNERKMKHLTFQYTKLVLYESSIPPLLRYFHIQNMSPSGWVSVNTSKCIIPTHRLTTCKYEYICKTSHIRAETEKETRVPYKICSFDIEASSSHGDFPLPVKTYKRLAMNMVDVFRKHAPDDVDQGIQLCKKMVLTAFGYSSFDDIDTVYPKEPISKSRIEKLLERFVSISMKDVLNNVSAATSDLMNIATAFEKMNTSEDEETRGFEEEEEEDADGEEDDEDTKPMVSLSIKKTASDLSMTIVELLMSNTHDREYKVSNIDKHFLASGFPPLEGDQVTFIGSTFMNYGNSEPYLNHCLVVGGCDPVDGAVIETAKSERELLLQWTQIIQRENPDIIIGYNIFGFDYEFMFRRSQELYCSDEFLMLSRKIGDLSAKIDRETGKMSIENTKIQLASGEYDLKYFKMAGRLQIDMYSYFRRDFNLPSYKLDDVAGQFISDDIKKVMHVEHPTFGPITELYSQNLMGLHVGDYIHIELGGFTSDYYKNGQKFVVVDIEKEKEVTEEVKGKMATNKYNVIMIQGHEHIGSAKSVKWGMAKDDVTPQDIFRLAKGTDADRAKVAKYCIQDCNLVHHLMNKIDVITGYVEMSRICSVPISFLIFRGQGIKLTSYVAKKCMEKDTLMPDLEKSKADGGYEGAIVLPPKCSMYMDNPVACVDYSSLYPSSMISQNFSHDSKVWTKEYDLDGKLIRETGERNAKGKYVYDCMPGYEYIDMEFDTFQYRRNPARPASKAVKTKCGKMVCRWAQFPDNRKGIMPSILEELLKARKDTRNMIKTEKDPFMQNILDKRQNGYKVTANSLYGQCGARTSTFYEKDVAACTTATGRMMITYAKRIIEEVYGNMVYETATHGPVKCNAEYVYGDSVASYTPIYVRNMTTKRISIFKIADLAQVYGDGKWVPCTEEGKQDKEVCELSGIVETWTEKGWTKLYRVIRHMLAPHKKMVRVVTPTGLVDVTDDHSLLLSDGREISPRDVAIGTPLLHHPLPTMSEDDGCFKTTRHLNYNRSYTFEGNDQIFIAEALLIAQQNDYYTTFATMAKPNFYKVSFSKFSPGSLPDSRVSIMNKTEIPYTGYVYDLTTENHHFAAGVGNMIVHNTDSVFFTFNLENPETKEKIRGKPALEMTIEIAQDAANLCTQWLKPPMALAYEKTLMPFILLSKKRYVGMLYEEDPNKGKLKYMGLSLKRRDSCDYLKDVYGGILNILMKEHSNIQNAIDFLDKSLKELIEGKVPMDKLMITKALRGDYKNPQQIAHRVLADRIGQRDPGNKPKPGDRMKFIHIVNDVKKALQGEKIETPEYAIANKLKIDYVFYITNQLMKPLQQLFGLALEQIWESNDKGHLTRAFKKDMVALQKEVGDDLETFMKKKEKYCSAKIKALLFDKYLTQIANDKNKMQSITTWFPASTKK